MLFYLRSFNLLIYLIRSPWYERKHFSVESGLNMFLDLFVADYRLHSGVRVMHEQLIYRLVGDFHLLS